MVNHSGVDDHCTNYPKCSNKIDPNKKIEFFYPIYYSLNEFI